jgi:hypothetical protein
LHKGKTILVTEEQSRGIRLFGRTPRVTEPRACVKFKSLETGAKAAAMQRALALPLPVGDLHAIY